MMAPSSPTDPRYLPLKFPKVAFIPRLKTERLVIHALDTAPGWEFDIREVDRWHREERKWRAIGYHYVISRDGIIVPGRPMDVIGSHTLGWNAVSIAIALAGGKGAAKNDPFLKHYTPEQDTMLRLMVQAVQRLWPDITVCGHHDHPDVTKTCPGFNVHEWLNQ
ncbi:endodeoxyribonuclease I [Caudoviricetes sp.]|nr:endodeoxyribonuclease I [Caudoviricetes sp.]